MQWQGLADRVVPILGFLLCITVVAELADRIGVFTLLADQVAVLARGSVARLWGLVVVLATLSTAVLSLDTTAVLITPVVLALATRLGLDRAPQLLSWRLLPWKLILGVSVLFVAVQTAQDHGLGHLLTRAAGTNTSWTGLLRLARSRRPRRQHRRQPAQLPRHGTGRGRHPHPDGSPADRR